MEKGLVRGRSIESVLAASLYTACRQRNVPRTLDEISEVSGVDRRDSGRGPTSTCAAAIYIASVLPGERRTQKEIADAAAVTEVTIRNRYKELAGKLGIEIAL